MISGEKSLALALETLLGGSDSVKTVPSTLEQHGHDKSHHKLKPPQVVVYPKTVTDVAKILEYCNKNRVPVVPFGTGTGLEGGITATQVAL